MNKLQSFTFSGRLRSVFFAVRGIKLMLRSQHNAWVHLFATLLVAAAGLFFGLSGAEWCCIVMATVVVWTAEALNTAFEFLCDVASPDFHPVVEKSKDVAAGAVLMAAMGAILVGIIVFFPKIVEWFQV